MSPNLTAFYNALMDVAVDQSATPLLKPKRKPGPTPLDEAHYEWFADWYRHILVEAPNSPVATLAKELNVAPVTIRRYRKEAIARGFLDLSAPGKVEAKQPPRKVPPKGKKGA